MDSEAQRRLPIIGLQQMEKEAAEPRRDGHVSVSLMQQQLLAETSQRSVARLPHPRLESEQSILVLSVSIADCSLWTEDVECGCLGQRASMLCVEVDWAVERYSTAEVGLCHSIHCD